MEQQKHSGVIIHLSIYNCVRVEICFFIRLRPFVSSTCCCCLCLETTCEVFVCFTKKICFSPPRRWGCEQWEGKKEKLKITQKLLNLTFMKMLGELSSSVPHEQFKCKIMQICFKVFLLQFALETFRKISQLRKASKMKKVPEITSQTDKKRKTLLIFRVCFYQLIIIIKSFENIFILEIHEQW